MAEVVAVASRSLAKAEAFIKDTDLEGQATAYGSYDELLNDPKVEAVYIPLPAGLRIQWVKKAAAKKLHVLSEKPIALVRSYCMADKAPISNHALPLLLLMQL